MAVRRLRNRVLALALMIASVVIALWIGDVTAGAIVGIGALGGLVSVVFIAKGSDLAAAYNVQGSQALLKVAAGAGTAILAVAILKGTGASTDTAHVYAYAAIFGFSQQAFTKLVDDKAQAVTSTAPARAAGPAHATTTAGTSSTGT
jgi:hypothetical protein